MLVLLVIAVAAIVTLTLAGRDPRITDVRIQNRSVEIDGAFFGDSGRVEIDGLAIESRQLESWDANRIIFRINTGQASGLLRVETRDGRSNPVFFSGPDDIPRVADDRLIRVTSLVPESLTPGVVSTIAGFGFGPRSSLARIDIGTGENRVSFTGTDRWVAHWSNREIRFVVPPEIPTGNIALSINAETIEIESRAFTVPIPRRLGPAQRLSLVQRVSLSDLETSALVMIPRIPELVEQPRVDLVEDSGELADEATASSWIYRTPMAERVGEDDELLPVEIVRTDIVERRSIIYAVPPELPAIDAGALDVDEFREAFRPDLGWLDGMRPEDPVIGQVGRSALEGFQNPLGIARQIHQIVVDRFTPDPLAPPQIKEALTSGIAPARAYADLAVLLARGRGLPARRHLGVYVDETGVSYPHAWAELFVPSLGWVPSDPALDDAIYGATESPFGTLDARRISIDVSDRHDPRNAGDALVIAPTDSYAPGLLFIELATDSDPESISVEWIDPLLSVQ